MRRIPFWLTISGTLVLVGGVVYGARFRPLGSLPGEPFKSFAYAVSGDGTVIVGRSAGKVVKWQGGAISTLGGDDHAAMDVSADGSVIVGTDHYSSRPMKWTSSGPSQLGTLDGGSHAGAAFGVSADGSVIVGYTGSASGTEAFRHAGGIMTGLGDLPGGMFWSEAYDISANGNVIVGVGVNASNLLEAFRWTVGGMAPLGFLPSGNYSEANGTNTNGSVVVGFSNGTSAFGTYSQAFRWSSSDGMEGLGRLPGAISSEARAVNADGTTVVGYNKTNAEMSDDQAFIWDHGSGMYSLAEVLDAQGAAPPSGWILNDARDVSDDGRTVVGYGTNPDGQFEAFKAVVNDMAALIVNSSTAGISQTVSTPDTDFEFAFDYRFETTTGALRVALAGTTLTSFTAPPTVDEAFATETIAIDGSLLDLTDVTLEFILEGPTGSRLVIDDIVFPNLPNGGFLLGLNDWQSVGNVAPVVIPEPATLALLALGGLGVLARRRRK